MPEPNPSFLTRAPLRVLIVGLGVVGLPLCRTLGAAGVELILCDFDLVELKNLVKQLFDRRQLGSIKCAAAAELVAAHDPDLKVLALPLDVRRLGVSVALDVDLVVGGPDNRAADMHCAALAAAAGRPYVRLATSGEDRGAEVRFHPPASDEEQPCGACLFTARDIKLIEDQFSCAGGVDQFPEAGALTFAEHGTMAAQIASDAILRGEYAPARSVRWFGGVYPTVDVTHLHRSDACEVGGLVGPHGQVAWDAILTEGPSEITLGTVVERACASLDSHPDGLLVEFDSPLTQFSKASYCARCDRRLDPHFRVYDPAGLRCDCCNEIVSQDPVALGRSATSVRELGRVLDRSLADLHAPDGIGMRFRSPTGETAHIRTLASCTRSFTDSRKNTGESNSPRRSP